MTPYEGNIFYLYQNFDESMESDIVVPLIKEIQRQRDKAYPRLDIWINSFGGFLVVFRQVHELLQLAQQEGIVVRTMVAGVAGSAASMLAIAGTPGERYIARAGQHAIHYGSAGASAESPVQGQRGYQSMAGHFKEVVGHYNKYSSVPDLEEKIRDGDLWINHRDVIRWGMADKTLDKLDIGHDD